MTVKDRISPANMIIAEFLDTDIDSVTEMVYQPTVYRTPRVYSWNDEPWSYFCCPREGQKPPNGFKWEIAGYSWRESNKDRPVYGVRYETLNQED
jgi:hypothetical protein